MFYVKLESSYCRIHCAFRSGSIDRELNSIDRKLCRLFFFCRISNSAQARVTYRVLCFVLSIKGKTLAMFWKCSICCVCESFVKSRDTFLHTYLGFPRFKIMSRTWWSIQLLQWKLKNTQAGVLVLAGESKKEGVRGLGAVTWSCQQ